MVAEHSNRKSNSYQIDLFGVEVFREEGRPVENIAALALWDLVKFGADQ